VALVGGSGGIFEVRVDGAVACKKTPDGIPANGVIVKAVRTLIGTR
jgi:predicted Rdx family selenoprotein